MRELVEGYVSSEGMALREQLEQSKTITDKVRTATTAAFSSACSSLRCTFAAKVVRESGVFWCWGSNLRVDFDHQCHRLDRGETSVLREQVPWVFCVVCLSLTFRDFRSHPGISDDAMLSFPRCSTGIVPPESGVSPSEQRRSCSSNLVWFQLRIRPSLPTFSPPARYLGTGVP